ncbi:hypothetical protein GCM10025873_04950 [Demequina sediminis]|nr:hypothetical protein GCM10025873_04950 [Demequina sediminis]
MYLPLRRFLCVSPYGARTRVTTSALPCPDAHARLSTGETVGVRLTNPVEGRAVAPVFPVTRIGVVLLGAGRLS